MFASFLQGDKFREILLQVSAERNMDLVCIFPNVELKEVSLFSDHSQSNNLRCSWILSFLCSFSITDLKKIGVDFSYEENVSLRIIFLFVILLVRRKPCTEF